MISQAACTIVPGAALGWAMFWTIVAPALAFAQQSPGDASSTPVLHLGRKEVVLDVVVVNASRRPVTTLDKKQFNVYEDGVEQRIVSFSAPADHMPPPSAAPVKSSADLRHAGNIPINIIVLDELNTAFEDTSYGRYSLQKYLNAQGPVLKQPTTIVSVSDSNLKMLHDYSQDRDLLSKVAHDHIPVYPFRMMKGGDAGPDAGERLARCLGALLQISQSVRGYEGRKNIIWIGRGFPTLDTDTVNKAKADTALAALKLVTSSLLESRVTLNIIDPTMMSTSVVDYTDADLVSPNQLLSAEGVNGTALLPGDIDFPSFAPATGGLAFFARNDIDKEIGTAIEDGANYYTISYSPTNKSDDDQKFRQINITLMDKSLTAWTRTGYYEKYQVKPGETQKPPDARQLAFDLTSAALATAPYSGLLVSGEKSGEGYKITVAPIGLEFRPMKSGAYRAEMTVMTVSFSAKGKALEHHANEIDLPATELDAPVAFTVKPASGLSGATRTRIVVRDAVSGHIGTVDLDYE